MSLVRRSVALALAILLGGSTFARSQQGTSADVIAQIDAIIERAMLDGPIAGVSVGVQQGTRTVVAKGYGYADLENRVPATEHTVYRIGSLTKQFTAAAIMLLVEQGALQLDDELTQFLPDYPTQGQRVTIQHLLTHTSGIKSYTSMDERWRDTVRLDLTHNELIGLFSSEPFDFSPGEQFKYNNSGYYLLGVIIEGIGDATYAEELSDLVWAPLGLNETYYLDDAPIIMNRAEGYQVVEAELLNAEPLSMRQPFSAGALGSSVVDLLRWQGALHHEGLLSGDSYRQMVTPMSLSSGDEVPYGYGLGITTFAGHRTLSHSGGINGFNTFLSYFPDDELTIVVLCNTESYAERIEKQIARVMLGINAAEGQGLGLPE